MKKLIAIAFLFSFFTLDGYAQQFDLSAEIRPRYENKHGYKSLVGKEVDAANFISQRTRLNFAYKSTKLKFGLTMQNVRVWGDVSTLSATDWGNSFHQAWAEALLSKTLSLKLGRQEIVYDDHRIFGSVGWAQQARSHDAFIFKYRPSKAHKLDVGFALNADSQAGVDLYYSNSAGYKNLQYAWYHGDFDKLGVSFLILNTGVEYLKNQGSSDEKQQTDYMQTVGPRLTYKFGGLIVNAAAYIQTGKFKDNKVNGLYYTGNAAYKINDNFMLGAGLEYLSGTDMGSSSTNIQAFTPLFGTNHKFNGWMDYFYVGNHVRIVGLMDVNAKIVYKKDKFSAKLIPHFFSAANDVLATNGDKMDANLGTEIDFTMGYKVSKSVKVNIGYSQMFATETMEILKGGLKEEQQSWAWVMFTFKPQLLSWKKDADK